MLEPTRRRGSDEPSTLDLIFSGEDAQVLEIRYRAPQGRSDHSVISFHFNCYFNSKLPSNTFLYDKANYEVIRQNLDRSQWQEQFIQSAYKRSVEENWLKLKQTLIKLRNNYAPQIKSKEWQSKGNILVSYDLHQLIKEKRRIH